MAVIFRDLHSPDLVIEYSSTSDWRVHITWRWNKAVALRGCLVGLDVEGLRASLLVTSSGSREIDYNGSFQIRDLHGSLAVDNAPLHVLENILGDVSIVSTVELANTGTHHENDQRTMYTPPPSPCVCKNIRGNLSAWFSRTDLKLQDIAGQIDVRNEFGNTQLVATGALAEKPHRIVSESGRIEVRLSKRTLDALPFLVLTNSGGVRTNVRQEVLESTCFTVGGHDGSRRNWRGLKPNRPRDGGDPFAHFERPAKVLQGKDRSPGVDLISRAGSVGLWLE